MGKFIVPDDLSNQRLDTVLASHDNIPSRAEAQRLIRQGLVTINDSTALPKAKQRVQAGDILHFTLPEPDTGDLVPTAYPLDIYHEDDHLLVVNKPSGMVVHPAAGHASDTLVNYLLHHTRLSELNPDRPGIVHRLDKDTSGLIVVAKTLQSHIGLSEQFSDHSIKRRYKALVWGTPKSPRGTVNKPLGRDRRQRKKFAIVPSGKHAITHWKVINTFQQITFIECRLETGRTHQIRVHMTSLGHPLLGDPV